MPTPRRPDHASPDRRVARTSARQHGFVTLAQALGAGLTKAAVRHRVQTGRWRRVHLGVYAVNGVPETWAGVAMAATLAAQPRRAGAEAPVAVAREAALWLRGVDRLGLPDHIDLIVRAARAPRVRGARVHTSRTLTAAHVTTVDNVPVTTGPRTLVDLAGAGYGQATSLGLLDDLVCADLAKPAEVHDLATQMRKGRAGVGLLADLTGQDAAARFRSWLERTAAEVFTAGHLPPPAWNVALNDGDGRVGIVDAVWAEASVVVELDGLRFHSTPAQRQRDRARDRRLQLAGWTVLRFTWEDVTRRPDLVVAQIRRALGGGGGNAREVIACG
jgi:predicted transcriptional regulator of viral defense system